MKKDTPYKCYPANGNQKKGEVAMLSLYKIVFKLKAVTGDKDII